MHVTDHADEYASRCLPFVVGCFVKALSRCRTEQWWRQAAATTLQVWRTLGQGLAANQPTEGRVMSGTYQGSQTNLSLERTSRGRAVMGRYSLVSSFCCPIWFWSGTGLLHCWLCSVSSITSPFPWGWSLSIIKDSKPSKHGFSSQLWYSEAHCIRTRARDE